MGGVNVLHGISGGTIAFMLSLYEEWIASLSAFDREAFQLLTLRRYRECWQKINGPFLLTVSAGILTGVILLTRFLFNLAQNHPIPLLSFFFGVIVIAAPLALRKIRTWNIATALALVTGIAVSYGLTLLPPLNSPDGLWFIFVCGLFMSCGLIWPGISCSFIAVLMGKYGVIVNAFDVLNIKILVFFFAGFGAGLVLNARITRAFLVHYHHTGVALLAGLMLGALNKVWPWRVVAEFATNNKGEQIPAFDKSIVPWDFMATTGKDPQVFMAILMIALGVFIVVLIEKIGARLKTKI